MKGYDMTSDDEALPSKEGRFAGLTKGYDMTSDDDEALPCKEGRLTGLTKGYDMTSDDEALPEKGRFARYHGRGPQRTRPARK